MLFQNAERISIDFSHTTALLVKWWKSFSLNKLLSSCISMNWGIYTSVKLRLITVPRFEVNMKINLLSTVFQQKMPSLMHMSVFILQISFVTSQPGQSASWVPCPCYLLLGVLPRLCCASLPRANKIVARLWHNQMQVNPTMLMQNMKK